MIKVSELCKTFNDPKRGEIRAVLSTSFEIEKGETFGLLGPNGAGKTTILRILSTVLTPTSGTASINGNDILKNPEDVKKSIGFLSGSTKPYGRLTTRELLKYFGDLYDMRGETVMERSEELFTMLGMHEFIDQRIDKLSSGQTQKTSIARCLLHDPPVLILDEPTLGLDILTGRAIIDFIRSSSELGHTVIFSTHYMEEAELLCDRIGLLHKGRLIDVDNMENYRKKTGFKNLSDIFIDSIENEYHEEDRNEP